MNGKGNNNNEDNRKEFLLHMYDQMYNDINRHISIIWQPITVLVGSLAFLVAGMEALVSIDIAVALIIVLVGWLIANVYDSAYWYNRNLVIIANIERQFLRQTDLRQIHYYFGKHRSKVSIMTHIRIQWCLGLITGCLVLLYHIFTQVLKICPFTPNPTATFRLELTLPYIAVIVMFVLALIVRRHRVKSYEEFIKNSPGIEVDTTGVDYGVGHPTDDKPQEKEVS